jgi:hypothetical protein
MPQPNTARSPIKVVLDRFPQHMSGIRRLFLRNEAFKNLCEDYALAVETLARFKNLPDADYRIEIPEYRDLIRELEMEILSCLRNQT